jgi:hypothetical protein
LIAAISISVGSLVFALSNLHYTVSESQGPYNYDLSFGQDTQAKDLGVAVTLNLSHFDKNWFVGERKNVVLEVSAEKYMNIVQNFSWRIFWVELFAFKDGSWQKVAHGSYFLNESEWNDSRLYKRQNISVDVVNLNYFESVGEARFRVGIMMSVYVNNAEYSSTFYTPTWELGSVTILSPLFSPMSLATVSAAATTLPATILTHQHLGKMTSISKKIRSKR